MRNDIHIHAVHPLPSRFAGENWKTWPFASSPMEQLSSTPGLFIGVIIVVITLVAEGGTSGLKGNRKNRRRDEKIRLERSTMICEIYKRGVKRRSDFSSVVSWLAVVFPAVWTKEIDVNIGPRIYLSRKLNLDSRYWLFKGRVYRIARNRDDIGRE